ncbi:MAG TPA: hypothetical protein VFR35_12130 [Actinoplanes sp.]|nr:hypothetical protein [Actinoplanes sp.]
MPDTLEAAPPAAAEKPSERASFRLAAFAAVLVVVLLAGYGVGRLNESGTGAGGSARQAAALAPADGHAHAPAEPAGAAGQPGGGQPGGGQPGAVVAPHDDTGTAPHEHNADGSVTPVGGGAGDSIGGLAVTSQGLTLVPETSTLSAGRAQALRFKITGTGGAPITTYAVVHDKPLHLIVVRRDLSGFQHLHPAMAPDGTWSIPLTLAQPGSYRAIADFTAIVGGRQVATTLGADLTVAGTYRQVVLPVPTRQAATGDFQVAYEGEPRVGSTQPLFMTVTTQGRLARLEPYLGAYGHLMVLREGDVGYVHVHPEAALADGKVKFWLAAPGPGRYRMFFDFQVGGKVHTAAWTAIVS